MAYVPPWKRKQAHERPQTTLWTLAEICNALLGVGSHTFVLAYDEDDQRAEHLVRIMHHGTNGLGDKPLPLGQMELWTRNHHALLQASLGIRLPLFDSAPAHTGGIKGKKFYEFCGWYVIDLVTIHAGGSAPVKAFIAKRNERNRKRHEGPVAADQQAAADSWACVRVRKCDDEVQTGLGSPLQIWVDKGRPVDPRHLKAISDQQQTIENETDNSGQVVDGGQSIES